MRGADVSAADQAPEAKKYLGGKPGGQEKVARTYRDQPPVIPHAVENFDEITLEENQCLSLPQRGYVQEEKSAQDWRQPFPRSRRQGTSNYLSTAP
jgi:cytochrome c-type protein NapB